VLAPIRRNVQPVAPLRLTFSFALSTETGLHRPEMKPTPFILAAALLLLGNPAPAATATPSAAPPDQFVVKTSDGQCEITLNTATAPELHDWAADNR
jgi:hypothetical protein